MTIWREKVEAIVTEVIIPQMQQLAKKIRGDNPETPEEVIPEGSVCTKSTDSTVCIAWKVAEDELLLKLKYNNGESQHDYPVNLLAPNETMLANARECVELLIKEERVG